MSFQLIIKVEHRVKLFKIQTINTCQRKIFFGIISIGTISLYL
ncbi:hypothetical protein Xbed_03765 [Xenorhabdus beddingii]|uniref:Uncharacterized protein n=1 Tax=Xenorhabdus beddingii TaxID=40578 RepID=A0A1Y2S782_9GAMM|nr:hypothetical protein Xbed_03765 [Xenorhabdus beddingii]